MVSLLILGVVVGWIALWVYVFKHAPNRGVRVGAVLVAVLIPFWDLPIGYFQLRQHCSAEGGTRLYGLVSPQDKVYFDSNPSASVNDLFAQGFKIVEIFRPDVNGVMRHEIQHGHIASRIVQTPESSIAVSITRNEELPWNIYRDQHLAYSLKTNSLVASYARFSWHGGWLQESTWPMLGTGTDCFFQPGDPLISLLRQGS